MVNYFAYSLIDRAIFAHEAKVGGGGDAILLFLFTSETNARPFPLPEDGRA